MSDTLAERLHRLHHGRSATASSHPVKRRADSANYAWFQKTEEENLRHALHLVLETPVEQWIDDSATLAEIWVELVRRQQTQPFSFHQRQLSSIATIYPGLAGHPALRTLILRFLIATENSHSLTLFARLLVDDPPSQPRLLVEIFGDLMRRAGRVVELVLPQLLEGLNRPELASFVLDFCNHAHRSGLTENHPATDRSGQLIGLLGGLADRLQKLQDARPANPREVTQLGRQVTESVALGVAACDALALIGDRAAVSSLNKALQVDHRRLRVEAAAALARLGEEAGREILPALAAEPAERLRVLAYAEELGLLETVADEFRGLQARVESELVMHLAEPSRFGLAPHFVELVDHREQPWPGFEDPQSCFLFRFVYRFSSSEYTNIGIAGPVVYSFDADLTRMSHDDIYALFAGWHVDHPDIVAIDAQRTVGKDQLHLHRLRNSLGDVPGYEDIVPALLGQFLGRQVLIASALRETESGWAIVSDDSYEWLPLGNPTRPLGAAEAFYWFVGRALLASFQRR